MRTCLFVVVLALAPMLGGCATIQNIESAISFATGASVTPQQVVIAINAFDAVEGTATVYLRLPYCGAPAALVCKDKATAGTIITWVRAGRVDRNTLKAALRANPAANLTLVDVYNDLSSLTSQIAALARR